EAEQILEDITGLHPEQNWAWRALAEHYARAGNTAGLKKAFSALAANDPKDFISRNNVAVACFLLNEDLPRAHELAREVYEHEKSNPGYLSTYAYSVHLQGRSQDALNLFKELTPQQLSDPGTAVYYGLVLAAVGDQDRALTPLEIGA